MARCLFLPSYKMINKRETPRRRWVFRSNEYGESLLEITFRDEHTLLPLVALSLNSPFPSAPIPLTPDIDIRIDKDRANDVGPSTNRSMAFLGITLEESVTINGKARNAEPSCESQVVGGRRSTCRWMTTETHSDESRLLGLENFEGNSKRFDGNSGKFLMD